MADKEYGVADMAKHLGLSEAVTRGKLRKAKVKRAGKSYSWKSKSALETDAKKVEAPDKKKAKKATSKRSKRASEGDEASAA